MNDAELLDEYASSKSEVAFRTLVERHLPLVYSAALRQLGNADMAEDVTQVVFIILARKATQLSSGTCLAGWLFRTTRHTAAKAVRGEQRRRRREQEAFQMQGAQTDDVWEQVAPWLDEALAQLGEVERNAVLLHYFQHKRLRDVGFALGLSEDAAEKRISRAIDKLRKRLLKRRVALPVAVIPGLLMARGAQVPPPALGGSVAAAALGQKALSTSAFTLLPAALRESLWPKVGAVLSKAAVLALVAFIASVTVHFWPGQTRQDPLAFSLESKIVPRSRSGPARPLPKPAPFPAVGVPTLATAPPPANPPPAQPEPVVPSVAASATNGPVPPPAVAKVEPAVPQPTGSNGPGVRSSPAVSDRLSAPAMSPVPYQTGYPVTWSSFPITPRAQPIFYYPFVNRQGIPGQPAWPQTQPSFYVNSAPWMPVQRAATPAYTKGNPATPTKRQP